MARPTQDSYPDNIVPLFGILSKSAKEKENCHFCLYEITKNEIHTMGTPCCNHAMHCNCFEEWKEMCSRKKENEYTTSCAYCRAPIPEPKHCFLCLDSKVDQLCERTACCNTFVHSSCLKEAIRIPNLSRRAFFECGSCYCIWTHNGKKFVMLKWARRWKP